jgi:hypothetical protein
MAVTLVGTSGSNEEPSGVAPGDLLVAFIFGYAGSGNVPIIGNGDWTYRGYQVQEMGGNSVIISVYSITRGASPPNMGIDFYDWGGFGTNCVIRAYRGVTNDDFLGFTGDNASENPLLLNPSSIEIPTDGVGILAASNWSGVAWSTPSGFGNFANNSSNWNEIGTWDRFTPGVTAPAVTNGVNDWGVAVFVVFGPQAGTIPVIESLEPGHESIDVALNIQPTIEFDIDVVPNSGNIYIEEVNERVAPIFPVSGIASAQNTNATSITVSIPAVSENDILICGVSKDGTGDFTGTWPPTGWSVLKNTSQTSCRSATIWRRFSSSASAGTITISGPSENYLAWVMLVRGAHTETAPFAPDQSTNSNTAGTPPAVSFPWGNEPSAVIAYLTVDGNSTVSAFPSGYTETGTNTTSDGTTGNRIAQAYGVKTGIMTGSETPGAFTNSNARWIGNTVAFRPANTDIPIEVIDITDSGQVNFSNNIVTITPSLPLPVSSLIQIRIDSGAIISDVDGGVFPGIQTGEWLFTTVATLGIYSYISLFFNI